MGFERETYETSAGDTARQSWGFCASGPVFADQHTAIGTVPAIAPTAHFERTRQYWEPMIPDRFPGGAGIHN